MMLADSLFIAASGMKVQGDRLRVVAENIANANSTGSTPEDSPYRRKTITFQSALDRELGIQTVQVAKRGTDSSDFNRKFMPGHPAADEEGYVLTPNVNMVSEMVDMREARRGYEANLGVVEVARAMMQRTLDILR